MPTVDPVTTEPLRKSFIARSGTISLTGSSFSQKLKFVNKKGTFKLCDECKKCVYAGTAMVSLGRVYEPTCDRDITTWRRMSGKSDKPCKWYVGESADNGR